jgi:Flp pilus assembly protein TadD
MRRIKIIALIALMAMVAACSGDSGDTTTTAAGETTTTAGGEETTTTEDMGETTTTAAGGDNPLAEFGEDPTAADLALVERALGPVEPSDEDSWNIILASVARASQDLDQATIDKAIECWSAQECDTGSGGDLVMGYADGGGDTSTCGVR